MENAKTITYADTIKDAYENGDPERDIHVYLECSHCGHSDEYSEISSWRLFRFSNQALTDVVEGETVAQNPCRKCAMNAWKVTGLFYGDQKITTA